MNISNEMKKLLKIMEFKAETFGPSSTGFSVKTFRALKARGLVTEVETGKFMITCEGNTASIAS